MLDLRQLQALRAVSMTGSIARAADLLGWSQPSVDHHLRNLDRLVGTRMLDRSTRGSTPTAAGAIMLERAHRILTLADRALEDVRAHSHSGQTKLRFGTFPTAASHLLPSIVSDARTHGIQIETTLEEISQLVDHVNHHRYDAVLAYSVPGYAPPFGPHVRTTEVLREPIQLAVPASHPLAQRDSIDVPTLVSLTEENWLLGATQDDPLDLVIVDAFRASGHTLKAAFRTDDFSVMLGLIAAEMVIGLVPRLAGVGAPPGVALRPIDDPTFTRAMVLAAPCDGPRQALPPAVQQFAQVLRGTITRRDLL